MKKLFAVLTVVCVLFLAFSVKTNAVSNSSDLKVTMKIDDTIVGSKCNGMTKTECTKKCDEKSNTECTKKCDGKDKAECEKKCDAKDKAECEKKCDEKDKAECEKKCEGSEGTQCKSAKRAKKAENKR